MSIAFSILDWRPANFVLFCQVGALASIVQYRLVMAAYCQFWSKGLENRVSFFAQGIWEISIMSPLFATDPLIRPAPSQSRYFDRELSWLAFNERVLANALDGAVPLAERLRFISISASNLDEFYMVRIAGLRQLEARSFKTLPESGERLDELLELVTRRAEMLKRRQQEALGRILADLKEQDCQILQAGQLDEDDYLWLQGWYAENILPLLSPTTLDPAHPFPFIQNRGKGVLIRMNSPDAEEVQSVILLPDNIERFICLPGPALRFVPVESALLEFLEMVYPGFGLVESGMFRVLRDSEIEIDDEADDLISQFESALRARRRGNVVSLAIQDSFSEEMRQLFSDEMAIAPDRIYITEGFIGLGDFAQLLDRLPKEFFYSKFQPRFPQRIIDFNGDCFAAIRNKDIIIHHPYESFDVVLRFLEQAARDPDVLTIRQTLYRTTLESPIVKALIAAAEAGKSVTALIELKARFDEENNIQLARVLERAGVQVAYGLAHLKIHAKLSLVIRREAGRLVSYTHCGTGNYHPQTAKIYTDLSYFTCDSAICRDVWRIFNYLTSHVMPTSLEKLVISPEMSHRWLLSRIEAEITAARQGQPAGVWLKCNALVDREVIDKLYEASAAGVEVHIISRGVCCLRPGVSGLSENIKVTSIIGRFLEHSRIYVFANGGPFGSPANLVYMSSADLMPRNLKRRVECFIPLENNTVRTQVLEQVLAANLKDTRNCWEMQGDGSYIKMEDTGFSAHHYFMENPSLSGLGSLANASDLQIGQSR